MIDKRKLVEMLEEAYRHGYATSEMVEAGLETPDAGGYAEWAVLGLDKDNVYFLIDFLLYLNDRGLINNHDFDYEKEAKKFLKKINKPK